MPAAIAFAVTLMLFIAVPALSRTQGTGE